MVAKEPVAAIGVIFVTLSFLITINALTIWAIWGLDTERLVAATLVGVIVEIAALVVGHFWLEEAKFVQHRENEKTTVRLGPGGITK